MLLSGNLVKYGDEGRTKQRHIATWQIYKGVLDDLLSSKSDYYCYDLSNFIKEYKKAAACGGFFVWKRRVREVVCLATL